MQDSLVSVLQWDVCKTVQNLAKEQGNLVRSLKLGFLIIAGPIFQRFW